MVNQGMSLSLAERDRRYGLIRQAMEQKGLDCLIIWGDSGKWDWKTANLRYVTQLGGNGEEGVGLFPRVGEPAAILWSGEGAFKESWLADQSWISDIRPRKAGWSKAVSQWLQERSLSRGRLGLGGLTERDRIMTPYGLYQGILQQLPEASLIDASGLLEEIRAVKSPEEIALMERAIGIGEEAIATLEAMAKPGKKEQEVVGAMMETMIAQGSEIPIMFLWDMGRPVRAVRLTFSRGRALKVGDVIVTEFSPRYRGYCPQFNQPAAVGAPPVIYQELHRVCVESYHHALRCLKPGVTVGELYRVFNDPVVQAGYSWSSPHFHGLGLGNEDPTGRPGLSPHAEGYPIKAGMVLAFEPGAETSDHRMGMHLGDPVLVTEGGARRLCRRQTGMVIG